ncbi:MAG: PDZ domain-containing protein [Firmicutes bacterium]|nr:PDZ domain-containing protein [Alicyclobacillaceae bacterium]MCL6497808.1 PDZ domain-containing protein [Bacillota bacterium]
MATDSTIAGYYRYPTVAGETVVFVSEDDLWAVPRAGGIARRLTTGLGAVTRPVLSPDGQWVAFTGKEEGDTEVYLMAAVGGPVQRLTYLGASVQVVAFHPDGRVVFASNHGRPFRNWFELYAVPLEGGDPEPLGFGLAHHVAFGPRGEVVLGRNTQDPARWKRYRGGTRGVLWIDAQGDGRFERFALDGNLTCPMWVGERIYFLSDHEGVGNLYSIRPDGQDLIRHTDHLTYYARNAQSDGKTIVYHAGADLYRYDPETGQSALIPVRFHSQRTERQRRFVSAARYLTDYAPSPEGHLLLVETRGKLFTLGPFEGPAEQWGIPQGVRYRLSQWVHRDGGDALVAVSDEGGEEGVELMLFGPVAERRRLAEGIGRVTELVASPDGRWAAFANHRFELGLIDLEHGGWRRLDHTPYGPITGLAWSPDSRWVAYSRPETAKTAAIYLVAPAEGAVRAATRPVLRDVAPVFDPEGRYLYFLGYRQFNPVYDNLRFDLGFPYGVRPYAIPLRADLRSPFDPLPRPETKEEGGAKEGETPAPTVEIDWEGIADRVVAFPVAEGRYLQIEALPGRVFYTVEPAVGSLGHSFFPGAPQARSSLKQFDLKTLKEETLANEVTSFRLAPNGSALVIRSRDRLRVVKPGEKVDDKRLAPGRESGIVDLERISVEVDPEAEWAQMQREAWRLMRDNFWNAEMSAVDWEGVFWRYAALLPRVGCRSEFSDLLWEMQGELGTSHAYEMGGEYRREPDHRVGLLGCVGHWSDADQGWRIDHVWRGDSWQEGADAPVAAPGVNLGPGDVIVAIDGQPLQRRLPPGRLLVNKANRHVRLAVRRAGQAPGAAPESVVVRTLESEANLCYRDWVRRNRERVHAATGGRIGYVHVPDMGPRGFAEFYRAYLAESTREGLIVDVRFNGGGHVSQLLLETLARRPIGYDIPRHGVPEPYPGDSVRGPLIVLTNEHAGSDGDIFTHAVRRLGLGPVLGVRTWGGVIGIWARHPLVDGTVTTQPEFSFWFEDVGYGIENYGASPDIEVENRPQDYRAGVDAQLERAIGEALERLRQNPPVLPEFGPPPSRALPTALPPRRA